MRKLRLLCSFALLLTFIPFGFGNLRAHSFSPNELYSQYAVLIDADTGQVLFDKNMHARAYPASTTKIMTGIIAVEQCFPGETLTVTKSAVSISEPQSSHIALSPGEELSFDSAMFAMMLPSANDASNVIAEHVAGSQEDFAELMNEKARLLGAVNTHFTNAHGLHEDEHYSTAYDIALITRYAAGNESFMRYFGRDLYTMPPTNLQPSERPFTNYQYMLVRTTQFYNQYVLGGKVGYTNPARHTMSTVAEKDGRRLICVVMNSVNRNEKFRDTEKLLQFGFEEFARVTLPASRFNEFSVPLIDFGNEAGEVFFRAGSDFTFLLHDSIDPLSLRFDYHKPDFIEKDGIAEITISLIADSNAESIPSLLATKLLSSETEIANQTASMLVEPDIPADPERPRMFYIIILGCSAALFVFSMLLLRRHNIRKRRKARLKRINDRMRAAPR